MTTISEIESIFLAALEYEAGEPRVVFLANSCGQDADLRKQVERLLQAHSKIGDFMNEPPTVRLDTRVVDSIAASANESETESLNLDFLSPPDRAASLGRLGHYHIVEVLGRGGFGTVLRADDDRLDRPVAIKVMIRELAASSPARKRFLREARAVGGIRHENVVQIYDIGESPLPYLVMEYVSGINLQQAVDASGPFDVPDVLRLGRQIAAGLAAAHERGIVHRDVKPANILLGENARTAKLTDFGLARTADDASVTQSLVIAGTPAFMSPEHVQGDSLDHRADLFSLGSVLYMMLTGHPPFRAPTLLGIIKRVVDDQPRPIREANADCPRLLSELVMKLLAKKPAARFSSATQVAQLLEQYQMQYAREPGSLGTPTRPVLLISRQRWLALFAGLLVLSIGGLMAQFLSGRKNGVDTPNLGQEHTSRNLIGHGITPLNAEQSVQKRTPIPLSDGIILPEHGWVSLLEVVDPKRDHIDSVGEWTRIGKGLEAYSESPESNAVRLRLPLYVNSNDYELEIENCRLGGIATYAVDFPVANRSCSFNLWSHGSSRLSYIDDEPVYDPSRITHADPIEFGRNYKVWIHVQVIGEQARLNASVDNEPHVHWEGPVRLLDCQSGLWIPKTIDLASYPGTRNRFYEFKIRLASGQAALNRLQDGSKLRQIQ